MLKSLSTEELDTTFNVVRQIANIQGETNLIRDREIREITSIEEEDH